jgi:hypothetical protein
MRHTYDVFAKIKKIPKSPNHPPNNQACKPQTIICRPNLKRTAPVEPIPPSLAIEASKAACLCQREREERLKRKYGKGKGRRNRSKG